jgi:hypothetical protein
VAAQLRRKLRVNKHANPATLRITRQPIVADSIVFHLALARPRVQPTADCFMGSRHKAGAE